MDLDKYRNRESPVQPRPVPQQYVAPPQYQSDGGRIAELEAELARANRRISSAAKKVERVIERDYPETQPRNIPQSPVSGKRNLLPWLLGLGSTAMLVLATVGVTVWVMLPDGDVDVKSEPKSNPIDQYFTTFTDGNYGLWVETLERFDRNEFRDLGEMNDFQQDELDKILGLSERDPIAAITSIKEKIWVAQSEEQEKEVGANRKEARKVIKSFVEGYEKWKR